MQRLHKATLKVQLMLASAGNTQFYGIDHLPVRVSFSSSTYVCVNCTRQTVAVPVFTLDVSEKIFFLLG